MYKILKIELDQDEENFIFDKLVQMFNEHNPNKQELNFPLNETVEVWSEMEVYQEYSDYDGNHQNHLVDQFLMNSSFKLSFFIDGEEVETIISQEYKTNIIDRLDDHYRIKEV